MRHGTKRKFRDEHGKTCTKCEVYKPFDDFYRLSASTDGRQSWCKACTVAYINAKAAARDTGGGRAAYSAAHREVRRSRGRAAEYPCMACSGPAAQWAYDHLDPAAMSSGQGPYSLDVTHYQPMCIPCHRRFDLGRTA